MKDNRTYKIQLISALLILLFLVLAARLWELQIKKGSAFKSLSVENRIRFETVPAPRGIIYDRNGKALVKNSPFFSVALLPGLTEQADLGAIAAFLKIDIVELTRIIKKWKNTEEPIRLRDGLSFDEVSYIEARLSDFPLLTIEVEQTRHYLYGEVGAHLIGYLGKLNPEQVKKADFRDISRQALIGQWGVEKMFDKELRGTPGKRMIEVDALGNRLREISAIPARKGNDLHLSIDIEMQKEAEEAFGNRMGALVAIDPMTGEILGLVSKPSFDPNLFSRGISYKDWIKLSKNKRYPMLNRALQSQFPPGSTFKLITAISALETEAITSETEVTCTGKITHGKWEFRDWKKQGHGTLSLHRAIVESCDVYFYVIGRKTGIDSIARFARLFGLGSPSGIGLVKEKTGLIPDRQWKKRQKNEPWYPGETYHAAIGQGFVLTTPIQLARMIAAIANDGKIYDLTLTKTEGDLTPLTTVQLKPETLQKIKKALRDVVNKTNGTGKAGRSEITVISGKTGTSQVASQKQDDYDAKNVPFRLRDHAWFVAYAPEDEPRIALAVFVEHGGHGGSAAAPIAKRAIETYMKNLGLKG